MDDTRPLSGAPRLLVGRYRLLGVIGQGGMAEVQRAYDEQLDREVAVKLLHTRYTDDRSFLLRFRREAQAAASLNHPNIVSVYDAGDDDGRPFIVMELVRGRSLREVTRSERLTAGRSIEIVGDSALALNYAHEHGLVHRDIKPGNILISQEGEVKVTDFGIARAVNAETITETAAVFGTAAYVSPEQAQGEPVDRRSDVYSLGCVLYELLAGQQPFHADSPVALAYQHVSAMPVPPSHLSDESTPELDAITLKAMAKNPDDRYQTAREFNADLERARAGVPVTAPMAGAYASTRVMDGERDRNNQTVVSNVSPSYTTSYPQDEEYYDDRYPEEEERRGRAGWIVLTILLLLALIAGGWYLFTTLTGDQVDVATLPDVVGVSQQEARQLLGAQGFENIRVETVERANADEDEVVEQNPEAGRELPVNTEIVLTVNTGAPTVAVPDVTGMTREEAGQALRDANLRVGDTAEENSDDVEEGLVISSDPGAEEQVQEETEVDLVISGGSDRATVPDVGNLPQEEATLRLNQACQPEPCFDVVITEEFDDSVGEGRVVQQIPSAGEEALKGSQVTLIISLGPDQPQEPEPTNVDVPDVVGLSADEAVAELQNAGLGVSGIEEQPSDEVDAGDVIETDPAAGESVPELTGVTLVVSSGPEPQGNGNGNGNGGGNG